MTDERQWRLLVQCESCRRQYDASGLSPGARFHCHCGASLVVPKVSAHDAAVVRCSSCGAARQQQASACAFCASDFTLHERDLHTVCPVCMARISDRSRFCHHCGSPIAPQGSAGVRTKYPCPACGPPQVLNSRSIGSPPVNLLECGHCGGLWLGRTVFSILEDRAQAAASAADTGQHQQHRGRLRQAEDPHGRFYRACPECQALMHRRNYGVRSGVLIDVCRQHGVWFDPGELDTILRWIRTGGLEDARKWGAQRKKAQQDLDRLMDNIEKRRAQQHSAHGNGALGTVNFVDQILDLLS